MSALSTTAIASSAVATNGTLTFNYPSGTTAGYFDRPGTYAHAFARGLQAYLTQYTDFTLTFNASTITFTYLGTTSIPAGTQVSLELETYGPNDYSGTFAFRNRILNSAGAIRGEYFPPIIVNLGTPAAGSATAILNATALAVTTVVTLSSPYVMDTPRAVTIKSSSTDTAVITIRGYDEFGVAMSESLTLNGTNAVNGKKAFASVVSYQAAGGAPSNNLSIGTTNILGLPVFLSGTGMVIRELQDGAAPTAGTIVAGVLTTPSLTTGDVRGTYTPNATPDAAKGFQLVIMATDPTFRGRTQYSN